MKRRSWIGLILIACAALVTGSLLYHGLGSVNRVPVERKRAELMGAERARYERILTIEASMLPLHSRLGPPGPMDWLASHDESGQTFAEYVFDDPVMLTPQRSTLYVQPIGTFDRKQQEVVDLTTEFMGIYFQCPVKTLQPLPESVVPESARREHPWRQMLTTYILDEILKPKLPDDAFALIGFTATDLWPGKGWNFVYGQASLHSRVGVWSINRNGEPNLSNEDFQLCLLRTMKLATHETGHMFSMQHCIEFECNMCGSNHRAESDGKPVYLCGVCLAKLLWATDADPHLRFAELREFCEQHHFSNEAEFYQKAIKLLLDQDANEHRRSQTD